MSRLCEWNEVAEDNLVFGPLVFGPVVHSSGKKIARLFVDEQVSATSSLSIEHHPKDVFTVTFGAMIIGEAFRDDNTKEYCHDANDGLRATYTELTFMFIDPENNRGETCLNTVYSTKHDIQVAVTYKCAGPVKRDVFAFMRVHERGNKTFRSKHPKTIVVQFMTTMISHSQVLIPIRSYDGFHISEFYNYAMMYKPNTSKLLTQSGDYYMIRTSVSHPGILVQQNTKAYNMDRRVSAISIDFDHAYGDVFVYVPEPPSHARGLVYGQFAIEYFTYIVVQDIVYATKQEAQVVGYPISHVYIIRGNGRKRCVDEVDATRTRQLREEAIREQT